MHNTPRFDPPFELPTREYYQLIHTLTAHLPPPLADTPEALLARDQAAIAQVAALMPVNASEAGFAAQCIAIRAQAEDVLRLIRAHEGDIQTVIRLNAQYVATVRASLGAHGHLLRAQAVRYKREQNTAALNADAWTQHIAASAMQQALDAGPPRAALAVAPSATARAVADQPPPAPAPSATARAAADQPPPPPAPVAQPSAPALAVAPPPVPAVAPPPIAAVAPPPIAAVAPTPVPVTAALPIPVTGPPTVPVAPLAPVPAAAPPPLSARAQPPVPVPPPPPTAAPPRPHRTRTAAQADEPPRDLAAETDYYAAVYPYRARAIRQYGGLPPDCNFGPPDDDLVRAIVTGTSPALRALDAPAGATA
jgi:hypothetical protein